MSPSKRNPPGPHLQDLVGFLSELHSLKVDLFLHQQGLDTTTPAGKAMFQMLGVFCRVRALDHPGNGSERGCIELAGRARVGRPPIALKLKERIHEALRTPGRLGVRVIAEQFGVDPSTVQRISKEMAGVPFEPSEGASASAA